MAARILFLLLVGIDKCFLVKTPPAAPIGPGNSLDIEDVGRSFRWMFIWLSRGCSQGPCPPIPASALNVRRERAPGCRSPASPRRRTHVRDVDRVSTRRPATPACRATETGQDHAPGDHAGRPREPHGAWPRIGRERNLGPAAISSLHLLLLPRSFFFPPRKSTFDRAGVNGYAEAASDRFDESFFALGLPLLDEVQYLIGAFVRSLRTAQVWKQTRDAVLRKESVCDIKSLPAHPERLGHLRDRLSLDAATPQHLVSNLYAIPRVKELVLLKGFVVDILRMGMKGMMFPKRSGLAVFGSLCF